MCNSNPDQLIRRDFRSTIEQQQISKNGEEEPKPYRTDKTNPKH
jgi:hypothetical protein